MRKILGLAVAGISFLALSAPASATLIDFAESAKNNERAVLDGNSETINGFTIKFSATDGSGGGFAYFDHSANTDSNRAGLGVCSALLENPDDGDDVTDGNDFGGGTNECVDRSDDNVTEGETLTLEFEFAVDLSQLTFRNGDHSADALDVDTLLIGVDGGALDIVTFGVASSSTYTGTIFVFAYNGELADEFYISSAVANRVPGPAALGLFGFGLVGLGGLARRRRS